MFSKVLYGSGRESSMFKVGFDKGSGCRILGLGLCLQCNGIKVKHLVLLCVCVWFLHVFSPEP